MDIFVKTLFSIMGLIFLLYVVGLCSFATTNQRGGEDSKSYHLYEAIKNYATIDDDMKKKVYDELIPLLLYYRGCERSDNKTCLELRDQFKRSFSKDIQKLLNNLEKTVKDKGKLTKDDVDDELSKLDSDGRLSEMTKKNNR